MKVDPEDTEDIYDAYVEIQNKKLEIANLQLRLRQLTDEAADLQTELDGMVSDLKEEYGASEDAELQLPQAKGLHGHLSE